jgi:ABC-type branched-subunit amino acid transport system substrate-binding protein
MWYQKGIADARQKHFSDAFNSFSSALDGGLSSALESALITSVEQLCANMSLDELTPLVSTSAQAKIQEIVRYYEIINLSSAGQYEKAQVQADFFRVNFPRSRFDSSVKNLVVRAKDQEKTSVQIGILAPLSGDAAEIGKKVVNGAQLAFEMHNAESGQLLKAVICDTKGNMMENARRTQELIDVHKVPVILGPVLSQDAIVSAAMVLGKNTMMLTPTATEDGIAQLGGNIFQMNVSIATLGRKIASYAMNNLNMKEFAILAPQNEYGLTLVNSFKDELKKKNIDVVAEEYFEEGGNDFSLPFGKLRNKLLQRYLEKKSAENGTVFKGKVSRADSIKYSDSTLSVSGLFIPAEAEDVVMLAPQVAFNRIRTQILGSNGWQSKKVIQDGSTYVQGAMISATVEPDQSSKEWMDFKKTFKTRFNYEPDKIAALGYDAANLVINAVRESGSDSSEKIAAALSKVHEYQGLSGVVSFDQANSGGSNIESTIMKLTPNGFVRVQ